MEHETRSTFTVDGIDHGEPVADHPGVEVARAQVHKTFAGPLSGTGRVDMTTALAGQGRGYVGVEWIEGVLDGRDGGFALLHCGTADQHEQWAVWRIVPGSGTGELAGIRGEAEIDITEDGTHVLTVRYDLPEA